MNLAVKLGTPILLALATLAMPAMAREHGDRHHDGRGDRNGQGYSRNDRGSDARGGDRRHDDRNDRGSRASYAYRDNRSRSAPAYRYHAAPAQRYYRSAPAYRYYRPAPPVARYGYGYRGGYHRGWARGVRYYDRGYGPTYVVNDYYGYGLRPPPRGYYWRRDDRGDFLLVAITTGIILDLILHSH